MLPAVPKKRYQSINSELRERIVQMLNEQHLKPKMISRQLNVNVPTIKAIQRVFRREGRIARKSKRDKFHVLRSNYAIILTGDSTLSLIKSGQSETSCTLPYFQEPRVEENSVIAKQQLSEEKFKILAHLDQAAQLSFLQQLSKFERIPEQQPVSNTSETGNGELVEFLRRAFSTQEQQEQLQFPANIEQEIQRNIHILEEQFERMKGKVKITK